MRATLLIIAILIAIPVNVSGQDKTPPPLEPTVAAASDEGQNAMETFKFPKNLEIALFAAEPDVANPVALDVDYQGRVFVCESFRQEVGIEDNREHGEWLNEDLAAQTVQDRINYIRRHTNDISEYTNQDDRIKLLLDTNHDGRADSSTVFANRFNAIEMGTGAGVLSYRGYVYYTCIPDLFMLKDSTGDNRADQRKSLHQGFGVRFAFRGHDMHGLIVGPDGRLYFSIGDRGYNVSPDIKDPRSGAVFRCELDGSNLEVVATGLRNPQELAFDDEGNLFTGDNNSDSGDKARWVFVVPGGDSGWRMHFQYLSDRGPFNREKIWHPYNADTPAYIVPPIANITDGPSGLAFYPGTGFGEHFKKRFFLCDFRGAAPNSGIRSFRNQADGAFFKVIDMEQTFWQTLATDLVFGTDGRLYISDWVMGWVGENKGRIYTYSDPMVRGTKEVQNVKNLLNGKIATLSNTALGQLLAHQDRRVRMEAQFELVSRGDEIEFRKGLQEIKFQRSALHCLWGLAQLQRLSGKELSTESITSAIELTKNENPEIRSQVAKFVGEVNLKSAMPELIKLCGDASLRVRYLAAMSLGKVGNRKCLDVICKMLIENNDQDPIVRHGGIMALKGIAQRTDVGGEWLASLKNHPNYSVRIAAVVALRKLGSPQVKAFLADTDIRVVTETARAIYDTPIKAALPDLANLIESVTFPDPLIRRIIHANLHGLSADGESSERNANALARFAASESADVDRRIEALQVLADWANPKPLDGVLGDWRPVREQSATSAAAAIQNNLETLLSGTEEVSSAAIEAVGNLNITAAGSRLEKVVLDSAFSDATRSAALQALGRLNYAGLGEIIDQLDSQFNTLPVSLASKFLEQISVLDIRRAVELCGNILADEQPDRLPLRQKAISLLPKTGSAGLPLLKQLVSELKTGELDSSLQLDVELVAETVQAGEVHELFNEYQARQNQGSDPTSKYSATLFGGDAVAGRRLFFGKTELSCVRCHKVNMEGGEVGPDLSIVGKENDRQYLLESIVVPNKKVTDGFAQLVIRTLDGEQIMGIVKSQTETELQLMDADGKLKTVNKDDIDEQKTGKSSMPEDLVNKMTKSELRDLLEYLSTLKTPQKRPDDAQGPDAYK